MFSLLTNPVAIGVAGIVIAALLIGVVIIRRYRIADPDQAIIVTGKSKSSSDLSSQKVVTGGGVFVMPFVQKSYVLSLSSRQLFIKTTAQTQNGITITAQAIAVVKVDGSEEMIRAAAQRFLSQQDEIEKSTQEVLSGSLRGIIGGLTVESIIRDRQSLAKAVLEAAEEALTKQGLKVDTLQIQEINDTQNYIANLGRPEAAKVLREAEVADVEASRAAEEAKIDAQKIILEKNRDLKLREAAIQQETDQALAVAQAAKPREDAIQRQKIVEAEEITARKEAELREQELNATVRKEADAEAYRITTLANANAESQASLAEGKARADIAGANAERERRELNAVALEREGRAEQVSRTALAEATKAEGLAEAEAISAKGKAEADAIAARAEALAQQSQAVLAQDAIKMLPAMAASFAQAYAGIDNMTIVSADGANKITGDMVGGITSVTEMLKESVGIDVAGILNGAVTGNATGNAIGAQLGKAQGSKLKAYSPKFAPVTPVIVEEIEEPKFISSPTVVASKEQPVQETSTEDTLASIINQKPAIRESVAKSYLARKEEQAYKHAENVASSLINTEAAKEEIATVTRKLTAKQESLIEFARKQFDRVEKGLEVVNSKSNKIPLGRLLDETSQQKLKDMLAALNADNLVDEEVFKEMYPLTNKLLFG